MKGETYFLVLKTKNGNMYKIHTKPVTLEELDKHTTKYNNKKELVETIIAKTNIDLKYEDVDSVKILMQKKNDFKEEKGPMYKKDSIVTNKDAIINKFELYSVNRHFVLDYIKNYEGIKNFKPFVDEIRAEINNNADYFDALYSLTDRIFKTYKGCRYTYLSIKSYDNRQKFKDINKTNIVSNLSSSDDIKEDELKYLIEHDRELLDIDDFAHYESISPFDGTGYGRSK